MNVNVLWHMFSPTQTAHILVCSGCPGMTKPDHRRGGITYEAAKAADFGREGSRENSPVT